MIGYAEDCKSFDCGFESHPNLVICLFVCFVLFMIDYDLKIILRNREVGHLTRLMF